MDNIVLSDRLRKILGHIIYEFIKNAEPVGSRSLSKKKDIELSSATIRNLMSDLEDLELIKQPHTSAGRIPTDKGYRFYVNYLLDLQELTNKERIKIKKYYEIQDTFLQEILSRTSKALALVTNYSGIALTYVSNEAKLKHIDLLKVGKHNLLCVLIDCSGNVFTKLVVEKEIEEIDENLWIEFQNFINFNFRQKKINDIPDLILENNEYKIKFNNITKNIIESFFNNFDKKESRISVDGIKNIFKEPEFQKHQEKFLNVIEELENVKNLEMYLRKEIPQNELKILIGDEIKIKNLKECSIISRTFNMNNAKGVLAILGPKRMRYSKVISAVNFVSDYLQKKLKSIFN